MSDIPEVRAWRFETEEVSAGVYRVRGTNRDGRSVEKTGTDAQATLEWCQQVAAELMARGLKGEPAEGGDEAVNGTLSDLDVAQILDDFINGTGGGWDWDDFLSIDEVANERLEEKRSAHCWRVPNLMNTPAGLPFGVTIPPPESRATGAGFPLGSRADQPLSSRSLSSRYDLARVERGTLPPVSGVLPIHRSMSQPFHFVTPDRLQIREGGGCMSVFGIPFFGAGVFMVLILVGVLPLSNAQEMPTFGWPLLVLMAIAFTAVGGGLVFGRSWTTIDRAQRHVLKQLGLLVPLRARVIPVDGYKTVTLGFVQGDSDTVDQFPISLTGSTAADLPVCSFTTYQQARECTRAIAEHLQLEIEDGTTDHPVRLTPGQLDAPIRNRAPQADARLSDPVRPPDARSQVTREMDRVTIVIPPRPMRPLVLATTLIPTAILLVMVPSLATFFKRSNTPDPVGWAFLGFLILLFGILPISTIGGAFLRSRRGGTIVEASRRGLLVHERGAWTTRTIGSFDAAEILDVDYGSRESGAVSARRAAEQQTFQAYPEASHTTGPRVDRIMTRLARFAQSKGITVKTRSGLITFGQGLEDEEIRYLYSVVRRALVE